MSRRTIIVTILLALISLVIIIAGQVFWVRKAYALQEEQFNKRVFVALSEVVKQIHIMNKDSAQSDPVKQMTSNYFIANINDTPQPYLLESLIKTEFSKSDLMEDFEYGIYDCFTDSIVFGSKVTWHDSLHTQPAKKIQTLKDFQSDGHYFGVLFPNKTAFIILQLDFWMYSSIVILLIIIFFSYTIFVMLRQKKLTDIRTDFVNNMTHELKTPISTIGLSAEALSQPMVQKDNGRLNQYINIIKSENGRLKTQVERVLQIASLTPKKVQLKNERMDVHELLKTASDTFQIQAEDKEGKLVFIAGAPQHYVKGDVVHITNVIHNLLDNAIKYAESKPEVTVRTYNDNDKNLIVEVADNGVGISRQHQKMIFEKFYRVPTGDLHSVRGFGLGLFYVKTVLKAHKANIKVTSEPGKGSTFTLTFKTEK
jgi:two-component system phosphate regulon sensor histidine kinase PhoR